MPTPQTEEPEKFPGGADALDDQKRYGEIPDTPLGVDLPPDKNPVTALTDDQVPELTEPDDKSQDPEDGDPSHPEPPA